MSEKTQQRKLALRDRLVAAAEARIEQAGLPSLRARDLATDSGCSLVAIYNVYDDLNAVVMAVNGRTFRKLGITVAESVADATSVAPTQRLIIMSNAYLHFAAEHKNLWRALFDVQMSTDGMVPDWYLAVLRGLFQHISEPLAEIFPNKNTNDLDLMTRALFSSVHGIVLLGLENRISGVPIERVKDMLAQVLEEIGEKN
ncbi:MAG: AcrR family transcriptional regulator [Paracoccaceae bacterium]|jgi:AcrR family transcriptional regulator